MNIMIFTRRIINSTYIVFLFIILLHFYLRKRAFSEWTNKNKRVKDAWPVVHTYIYIYCLITHFTQFHSTHISHSTQCADIFLLFFLFLFFSFCSLIVKDVCLLVRISIIFFFFSISYTHAHFCSVVDLFDDALHSHRMKLKKSVSIKFYSPYRYTLLIPYNITIILYAGDTEPNEYQCI